MNKVAISKDQLSGEGSILDAPASDESQLVPDRDGKDSFSYPIITVPSKRSLQNASYYQPRITTKAKHQHSCRTHSPEYTSTLRDMSCKEMALTQSCSPTYYVLSFLVPLFFVFGYYLAFEPVSASGCAQAFVAGSLAGVSGAVIYRTLKLAKRTLRRMCQ